MSSRIFKTNRMSVQQYKRVKSLKLRNYNRISMKKKETSKYMGVGRGALQTHVPFSVTLFIVAEFKFGNLPAGQEILVELIVEIMVYSHQAKAISLSIPIVLFTPSKFNIAFSPNQMCSLAKRANAKATLLSLSFSIGMNRPHD